MHRKGAGGIRLRDNKIINANAPQKPDRLQFSEDTAVFWWF